MNDNPNNGQFTVNFDDQGKYLGTGTAPEHLANFDLTAANAPAHPQARSERRAAPGERAAVDAMFANFQDRLRLVAGSQPKSQVVGVTRR